MGHWTPEAVAEAYRRAGQAPPADLGEIKPVSKYHSRKKEVDGIVFDSCAEALAYRELKVQQQAGAIVGLTIQPHFLLQPAFRDEQGKHHRAISYIADFRFFRIRGEHESDQEVVVDVKGVRTPVFNMKEKMFRQRYPHINLEIWDTRRRHGGPGVSEHDMEAL